MYGGFFPFRGKVMLCCIDQLLSSISQTKLCITVNAVTKFDVYSKELLNGFCWL